MTLNVEALKAHLNIAGDLDAVDGAVLPRFLTAATRHVENDLGIRLTDFVEFPDGPPEDVEQAVLMLAAHWYENREATLVGVTAQQVPFGYDSIIANHRSYTFG